MLYINVILFFSTDVFIMLSGESNSRKRWKLSESRRSQFSDTRSHDSMSSGESYLSDEQQERFFMYLQWMQNCREHDYNTENIQSSTEQISKTCNELLEKSAAGDVLEVSRLLKEGVGADTQNENGWTALMFAVKNGHDKVIDMLLANGCRSDLQTSGGHTAADIARLWSRKRIASILSNKNSSSSRSSISNDSNKSIMDCLDTKHSSFNVLLRCTDKRKDLLWLEAKKKDASAKYILFSDLQIYVSPEKQTNGDPIKKHKLITASYKDIDHYLEEEKCLVIFLGIEEPLAGNIGEPKKEHAWFAVDISSMDKKKLETILPNGYFISPFPAFLNLNENEKSLFCEACSLILWHVDNQFCPTCSYRTIAEDAGLKRVCSNGKCTSRSGLLSTNYPRVDPNVVMLVINSSQTHCLLGVKKNFPPKMYFCVSGFVEPGESIEDACSRELLEQTNLTMIKCVYHSSQPWPYPVVLLLGCIVHVASDDFKINEEELKAASWLHYSDIELMIKGKHEAGYRVPSKETLTHQMLDTWLDTHRNTSITVPLI
ncbi:peroxisomal NADH pyrophosphatase NUDT12-like [Argonauta hians]